MKHLRTYESFSHQDFESIDEEVDIKKWLLGLALSTGLSAPMAKTIAQEVPVDYKITQTIDKTQFSDSQKVNFTIWMLNKGFGKYAIKNAPSDEEQLKDWSKWIENYTESAIIYLVLQSKGVSDETIQSHFKEKFGEDFNFRQLDRLIGAAEDLSIRMLNRLEEEGKTRDYLRFGELTDIPEAMEEGREIIETKYDEYLSTKESFGYRYKKFHKNIRY